MLYNEDTIAAISTPAGFGGIAIVRMSGQDAFAIAQAVFVRPNGASFEQQENRTICYGHIIDEQNEVLDEVLLSKMRAPHTFTTEDIVEINCHGGIAAASAVLSLLCDKGARLAEGGEFTKRAYLNGRIDLSQAEAVADMINAKTLRSVKAAASQLGGGLREQIEAVQKIILSLLSELEVTIQYPEYDVPELTDAALLHGLSEIKKRIVTLLATYRRGAILRDGFRVAIAGKPNVGKSMLLNCLLNRERAIVTELAGTTRDTIDEYINLDGIPVCIIDTAGIRESDDQIESLGISRSREAIEGADAVIFVADGSEDLTKEDQEVLALLGGKEVVYVLNKADKPKNQSTAEHFAPYSPIVLSALTRENLPLLEARLTELSGINGAEGLETNIAVSVRHKGLLEAAQKSIEAAIDSLKSGIPSDMIAVDIAECRYALGGITGETAMEDVVDEIFRNYCLGK